MEPQSNTDLSDARELANTGHSAKPSGVKAPLSAERLQSLAMARQKAAEVRKQRAAQKVESRELQKLEAEVERQKLTQRRQELESALKDQRDQKDQKAQEAPKKRPPSPPSSDDDDEPPRRLDTHVYKAKLRQAKEDAIYRALFG